jgi:hypothetical protein
LKHLLVRTIRYLVAAPLELSFIEQYEHSPLVRASRKAAEQSAMPIARLLLRGAKERKVKNLPLPVLAALTAGPSLALAKVFLEGTVEMSDSTLDEEVEAILDSIMR